MLRLVACTLGLSALLLFVVQPMLGRALLPLLGGAPAVWTTVMLFFQTTLLLGYAYAHASARWLPWRAQLALHVLLVGAGVAVLPFSTAGAAPPATDGLGPALWVAGWLTLAVGLPVVALSASAPLLQGWVARAGVRDPYPLYAASNLGSLTALLGYPLAVEPLLGVAAQARAWMLGYALLVVAVAVCAVVVDRATSWRPLEPAPGTDPEAADGSPVGDDRPLDARRVARWLLLSATPVALLLGVTTHMTTDLSAVPLLWVAPLAVYLVTFIVTFDRHDRGGRLLGLSSRGLALLASPLLLVLATDSTPPLWAAVLLDLTVLLAAGLVCHGALAGDRPAVRHLTVFYLCIALGGVLGGALCAVVAPLVFDRVLEYPLAIAAACALRPSAPVADGATDRRARRDVAVHLAWAAAVAVVALGLDALVRAVAPDTEGRVRLVLAFAPGAVLAHAASGRPARHAPALLALLACGLVVDGHHGRALHSERSFFGVLRVTLAPDGRHRWLVHGGTVHGAQALDPERAREPLVYYHRMGPCGDVVAAWRATRERIAGAPARAVGVVGLGVGSLAAYAEPGEDWTFFELDPAVERLARDERFFTFLRDCRGAWRVVAGDARLRLRDVAPGSYGLLFLDAFSGDAIPAHLLTREAMTLEAGTLAPGGLMAVHVSNRYLDLVPVVARTAASVGLVARVRLDDMGEHAAAATAEGRTTSQWMVLARREEDLGPLVEDRRWRPVAPDDAPPWTDDHAHVLGALSLD